MADAFTLYGMLFGAALAAFVLASMVGLPFLAYDEMRAKRARRR